MDLIRANRDSVDAAQLYVTLLTCAYQKEAVDVPFAGLHVEHLSGNLSDLMTCWPARREPWNPNGTQAHFLSGSSLSSEKRRFVAGNANTPGSFAPSSLTTRCTTTGVNRFHRRGHRVYCNSHLIGQKKWVCGCASVILSPR